MQNRSSHAFLFFSESNCGAGSTNSYWALSEFVCYLQEIRFSDGLPISGRVLLHKRKLAGRL